MFRCVHRQTKEVIEGPFDQVKDLDNRVWDKVEMDMSPKSHSEIIQSNPLGYVLTTFTNQYGVKGRGHQPIWHLSELKPGGPRRMVIIPDGRV